MWGEIGTNERTARPLSVAAVGTNTSQKERCRDPNPAQDRTGVDPAHEIGQYDCTAVSYGSVTTSNVNAVGQVRLKQKAVRGTTACAICSTVLTLRHVTRQPYCTISIKVVCYLLRRRCGNSNAIDYWWIGCGGRCRCCCGCYWRDGGYRKSTMAGADGRAAPPPGARASRTWCGYV